MTDESVITKVTSVKTNVNPKTNQLLRAATDVFHEHGFHGAKVSDITSAAGVAQGTFYLYFTSKDEIFLEVLQRFASDLQAAVLDFSWTGVKSLDELADGLQRVLVSIFTVCADQREAAALFFGVAPGVSEETRALREQFLSEAEEVVVGYLADGMEVGHVRPLDLVTVSRAIVGYVVHALTRTVIGEGRSEGFEALAAELLRFELYGIIASRDGVS